MTKRVGVFVDIPRMYHSVSIVNRSARINYERYLKVAVGDDELHRAYAYGVQIKDEAIPFISALRSIGYEPKYKTARIIKVDPLENEIAKLRLENQSLKDKIEGTTTPQETLPPSQFKQSIRDTSWNIGIAMDVVRNIRSVDSVVIGSNDPELYHLVEWIKEQGIKVTIFSYAIHRDLRAIADLSKEITDDILDVRNNETV